MMKRKENWPEALNAHIDKTRPHRRHAWGSVDCLFTADAVLAMTGIDPAKELRGYTDAEGAYRSMKAFADGGAMIDVFERMAKEHGWTRVQPNFLQRGDVVVLEAAATGADPRFGGVAAVCIGPMLATISEGGMVFIPHRGPKAPQIIVAYHFE